MASADRVAMPVPATHVGGRQALNQRPEFPITFGPQQNMPMFGIKQ